MSRTTSEANPLGTFGFSYVDDVSGSSKGTTRLASVSYPNGQTTNFTWYGNLGDQRLQSINNLLPSGTPLSQCSYGYDPAGEIKKWGQQSANLSPRIQNLGYDAASQLTSSQSGFGAAPPKYADQFYYGYDCAANRTAVQSSLTQTAQIKGTVTSGDTLTITVNDPALSGGTRSVPYTVTSGDSLSSIATKLAAAITADTNLQTLGVNAIAASSQISMKSTSANLTSYSESTSGGATESIVLGLSTNAVQNATIGGTVTAGNVLTLNVFDAGLSGGTASVPYTVASGNNLNNIASGLATAVNGNTALSTAGITATTTQNVVHLKSTSSNLTTYSQSLSSGATETIYLALNMNGPQTVLVSGTKTTGDVLGISVFDATLTSGTEPVSHTVGSSDTLSTIASALASAINSDTNLQNIGVSATSSGTIITLNSMSTGVTSYQVSRPSTATETLVAGLNPNGVETAVISGSKTTGDTVTITVYDAGISGGSKAEPYVVQSTDTLNSIAAGLAGVISGDSTLSALGITASSSSNVLDIASTSNNLTTFAKSTSTGATETITLGQSTGITQYVFNNLNELASTSGGGVAQFQGTTNKPIVSATIDSNVKANLSSPTSFCAQPSLSSGANSTTVNIVDGNNNSVTNTYQIGVHGGPSATLSYDANGNCTSVESSYCLPLWDILGMVKGNADSELSFASSGNKLNLKNSGFTHRESRSKETLSASQDLPYMRISPLSREKSALLPHSGSGCTYTLSFDAENRLIQITYPGTGNYTTFVYDGLGRNVSIVETTAGSVTSTKQFVWCGNDRCEQRDSSSTITAQFFARGEIIGGTSYLYCRDALGSVTEMTDSSGTIQAEYAFDPYGRVSKISESIPSDFQYAGYYLHSRSGLNLTCFRAYAPQLGRWINRDPIEEDGGINLFGYVDNAPVGNIDPLGLDGGVSNPTNGIATPWTGPGTPYSSDPPQSVVNYGPIPPPPIIPPPPPPKPPKKPPKPPGGECFGWRKSSTSTSWNIVPKAPNPPVVDHISPNEPPPNPFQQATDSVLQAIQNFIRQITGR